jgi:hypothetical protein
MIERFQTCFPELSYDMDLGVDLANAQAFVDHGIRRVRLYGGLVRHRRIGRAGLAVALAHETGHHLAGPPFLQFYRWLSSEQRSTEWAISDGLSLVFGKKPSALIAANGMTELRTLLIG